MWPEAAELLIVIAATVAGGIATASSPVLRVVFGALLGLSMLN